MEFTVVFPELAFLRFEVCLEAGGHLRHYTVPVMQTMEGYHYVWLEANVKRDPRSSLFISLDKTVLEKGSTAVDAGRGRSASYRGTRDAAVLGLPTSSPMSASAGTSVKKKNLLKSMSQGLFGGKSRRNTGPSPAPSPLMAEARNRRSGADLNSEDKKALADPGIVDVKLPAQFFTNRTSMPSPSITSGKSESEEEKEADDLEYFAQKTKDAMASKLRKEASIEWEEETEIEKQIHIFHLVSEFKRNDSPDSVLSDDSSISLLSSSTVATGVGGGDDEEEENFAQTRAALDRLRKLAKDKGSMDEVNIEEVTEVGSRQSAIIILTGEDGDVIKDDKDAVYKFVQHSAHLRQSSTAHAES